MTTVHYSSRRHPSNAIQRSIARVTARFHFGATARCTAVQGRLLRSSSARTPFREQFSTPEGRHEDRRYFQQLFRVLPKPGVRFKSSPGRHSNHATGASLDRIRSAKPPRHRKKPSCPASWAVHCGNSEVCPGADHDPADFGYAMAGVPFGWASGPPLAVSDFPKRDGTGRYR